SLVCRRWNEQQRSFLHSKQSLTLTISLKSPYSFSNPFDIPHGDQIEPNEIISTVNNKISHIYLNHLNLKTTLCFPKRLPHVDQLQIGIVLTCRDTNSLLNIHHLLTQWSLKSLEIHLSPTTERPSADRKTENFGHFDNLMQTINCLHSLERL